MLMINVCLLLVYELWKLEVDFLVVYNMQGLLEISRLLIRDIQYNYRSKPIRIRSTVLCTLYVANSE